MRCRVMDIRTGDRFEHKQDKDVWEVLEITTHEAAPHYSICIKSSIYYKLNQKLAWKFGGRAWNYLGNFSKVDNFEELYNLLNEDYNR